MTQRIGKRGFISYRSSAAEEYDHASVQEMLKDVANLLLREIGCLQDLRIVPPARLALDHELMMPFEWFELMMGIWTDMADCDAFVFINSEDYFESVWTNLEVTGWRVRAQSPIAYALDLGDNTLEQVNAQPMSRAEKSLWGTLYNQLRPFALLSRPRMAGPPDRGGPFSTNFYLLPCRSCGEYSLHPKRLVESQATRSGNIKCAHCNEVHRLRQSGNTNSFRRRVPILAIPASGACEAVRELETDELLELYMNRSEPPSSIPTRDS